MTPAMMHIVAPPQQISVKPTKVLCEYLPEVSFSKYLKSGSGEEADSGNWHLEMPLSGHSSGCTSPVPSG